MRCKAAAVLAAALAAGAGCGASEEATEPPPTATSAFAEPQSAPVPAPAPPATPMTPPSTEQPVATTIRAGLPTSLAFYPADVITLGAGSTTSVGLTVRGVPLDEVQAFVVVELGRLGWSVGTPVAEPDGDRRVPFVGPGAEGSAVLTAAPPDLVDVTIVLGPRPS